jgi:hypothetical protein
LAVRAPALGSSTGALLDSQRPLYIRLLLAPGANTTLVAVSRTTPQVGAGCCWAWGPP